MIDIKFDETFPVSAAPQQGENNAIVLRLHLPTKFIGTTVGLLVCQVDGKIVYSGSYGTDSTDCIYISGRHLYVRLWRALTSGMVLRLQATAVTPGGETVKTPVSPQIVFCASLPDGMPFDDPPNDLISQLLKLISLMHTHPNKSILDLFSRVNGELLFDGNGLATDSALNAQKTTALSNFELEELINNALATA
jgi:hypothetical protein